MFLQGNCPPCGDSGAQKASPSQSEVPWLLWQRKRKTGELAVGLSVLQLGSDRPHFLYTSHMDSLA